MPSNTSKRALIVGVTGQDGAYLARLLLEKGYVVFGTSRDADLANLAGLRALGISEQVQLSSMSPTDFRSVFSVITSTKPSEIYNLAGQSSVGLSFALPAETMESIVTGTLNLLEAVRLVDPSIRFYNAGSSECFGDTNGEAATEDTAFRPRSPYGVAKAAAFWQVANYREAYGLFCSSGILFNHESPIRPARFVTRKIVSSVARIARGSGEKLSLGNLEISRDWGAAQEYVDAMWRMLQIERAGDYVIATGQSTTLQTFVEQAFAAAELDWRDYVIVDETLLRPTDILVSKGDAGKAAEQLGWRAQTKLPELIQQLVAAEMQRAS